MSVKKKNAGMLAGLFLLVCVMSAFYLDKPTCLMLLNKIQSYNGLSAFCIFSLVYILSNLLVLPLGLPLCLLAGMLWGTIGGGVLINILATFVAGISFYLGRWFGHYFLEDMYYKYAMLANMKKIFNRYDWQFISLARINPIVPFGLSNYLFGTIPELSFRHYIIVTAIANLIPSLTFASIGSILKTYSVTNGNIQHVILKIGLALLLLTVLFIFKIVLPRAEVEQ